MDLSRFRKYKGLIVDFDGTLVDSHEANFLCWQTILSKDGIPLTKEMHQQLGSFCSTDYLAALGVKSEKQRKVLASQKDKSMSDFLDQMKIFPQILDIVKLFSPLNVAIASGNSSVFIITALKYFKVEQFFNLVIGSEQYSHGKPNPEPYTVAAKKLGLDTKLGLPLEDSDVGVNSAISAGLDCVKIVDGNIAFASWLYPSSRSDLNT